MWLWYYGFLGGHWSVRFFWWSLVNWLDSMQNICIYIYIYFVGALMAACSWSSLHLLWYLPSTQPSSPRNENDGNEEVFFWPVSSAKMHLYNLNYLHIAQKIHLVPFIFKTVSNSTSICYKISYITTNLFIFLPFYSKFAQAMVGSEIKCVGFDWPRHNSESLCFPLLPFKWQVLNMWLRTDWTEMV